MEPTEEDPAAGSKRDFTQYLFFAVPIGSIVGMLFANVSPSPLSVGCGVLLGAMFGVMWILRNEARLRDQGLSRDAPGYWLLSRMWLRIPLTFLFGLAFGYMAFAWAVPWAVDKCVGTTESRPFVVTGVSHRSRYVRCERFEVGHGAFVDAPHAFCFSDPVRSRQYVGTKILVKGPATALGINTNEIFLVTPSPAAPTHPD